MRIDFNNYDILKNHLSTLKDTSTNDASETMIDSQYPAVNFDHVKREYVNSFGRTEDGVESPDALLVSGESLVFAEFKNGKKVSNSEVKYKALNGLIMLLDILDEKTDFAKDNLDFTVVYNPDINPISSNEKQKEGIEESGSRDHIKSYFITRSGDEFIRFGLNAFKNIYFKSIHTLTPEQFVAMYGVDC